MSFGRLSRAAPERPMSDINVTPMVDVMLVLLVIFIMAAPALGVSRVPVSLPTHSAAQAPASPATVGTLLIDAQGGLLFNGVAVQRADLPTQLARWAQASPGVELLVQADTAVPYGQLVSLMDMAQAAGVAQLGLAAQGAPAPKP
ncbi:MAG: ExbD/TolR family protein [Hydrogenophaga sp.]|jgi:biopolymer transport protein TolR